MSTPDFFSDITVVNNKEAIMNMCLRNATKYAIGEIKMTRDLQNQLKFAWDNSNQLTRDLLGSIFGMKLFLEDI